MEKNTQRQKSKGVFITLIALVVMVGLALLFGLSLGRLNHFRWMDYLTLVTILTVIFASIYIYLNYVNKDSMNVRNKDLIAFLSIIIINVVICLFCSSLISIYFRPYAIAGLMMALLKRVNYGLIANMFVCVLLVIFDVFFANEIQQFLLLLNVVLGFSCGTVFIIMSTRVKRRFDTLVLSLKFFGITLVVSALMHYFVEVNIQILLSSLLSGGASILSMLAFISLLPLYERLFNYTTDFRLHELTDHDNKVLRELCEQAPGTFNHSVVLANLAEMCALAIGENSNLARACAYYHDIGKLKNTAYFKENQGEKNPHDDITPEVSVNIIKNHVTNGVVMAKENKLPEEIINVIKEHHGTLPIKVFYYKAMQYTDGELNIDTFSYDGPKPTSKISAIIMLADASEAAARVVDKTPEAVEKAIEDIINERMRLNQFTDCNITFKEIFTIKEALVKTLSGVYHTRVKYPDIHLGLSKEGGTEVKDGKE